MINSLGLIFFLPMIDSNTTRGIISSIVIINGILCHTTRYLKTSGWEYIRNYDIFCNVIMALYILQQSQYNIFILYTIIHATIIFLLNYFYYEHHPLLHILGVQLPLSIGTYSFG